MIPTVAQNIPWQSEPQIVAVATNNSWKVTRVDHPLSVAAAIRLREAAIEEVAVTDGKGNYAEFRVSELCY